LSWDPPADLKATKAARLAWVRQAIRENEGLAYEALLIVEAGQTAEEIQAERTVELNGRGFSGNDGEILTSMAEQLKGKRARYGDHDARLSEKQVAFLQRAMPRYAGQVAEFLKAQSVFNQAGHVVMA
jgi:hypothetical protein